jgi:hypothetical protein
MPNAEIASWVFGAISLIYLGGVATYLMVRKRADTLDPAASFIVGFLCAIAGGFCTYFFSGKLGLAFEVPGTNIKGDAVGGIGVFVLVLLLWTRHGGGGPRNVTIQVTPAQTLETIDRVLRDLEHVWAGVSTIEMGKTPTASVTHTRQGHGNSAQIEFRQAGQPKPIQVLTIDEVRQKLSKAEMQLLADTEAAMQQKLVAWRREYANVGDPANANTGSKKKLLRIASGMSDDLDAIFQAIDRTLNGQLLDHYAAERWVASRAASLLRGLSGRKGA